jgi:hypothetical protein
MPEALALLEYQDQQGTTATNVDGTAAGTAAARAAVRDGDTDSEVIHSSMHFKQLFDIQCALCSTHVTQCTAAVPVLLQPLLFPCNVLGLS